MHMNAEPESKQLDLLATGYPSLDYIFQVSRSPGVDETAIVTELPQRYTFGGCGANVCVGLAALGYSTAVAMVVGDDQPGTEYVRYLEECGVDTSDVTIVPASRTSQSRLFRNTDGDYQNFFYPGAADEWKEPLVLSALADARAALLTVGAPHYNRAFADRVRSAEVPLIWQLKSDVYSYPPEELGWLGRESTLLFMNRAEQAYLTEETGIDDVRDLLRHTAEAIVITEGSEGSRIIDTNDEYRIPTVPPDTVVDTTGAGDAYTAGFLAGWLRTLPPRQCGQIAATVASFVVEALGCQTNVPDVRRLAQRYEHYVNEPLPAVVSEEQR